MSAFSSIDIANAALAQMAVPPVTSFAGSGRVPSFCALNYEILVRDLLSKHPWRWAMTQDTLALNSVAPKGRWTAAYQLPASLIEIRAVTVGDVPIEFDRYEDNVYCNASSTDAVILDYTYRPGEAHWPAYFTHLAVVAFTSKVAAGICRQYGVAAKYKQDAFGDDGDGGLLALARRMHDQGRTASTLAPRAKSRFLSQR